MAFLSSSFNSALPLISPSMPQLVSLLMELFSQNRHPSILVTSGTLALIVHKSSTDQLYGNEILNLLSHLCTISIHSLQAIDGENRIGMEVHPDLSEAFFDFVTRVSLFGVMALISMY